MRTAGLVVLLATSPAWADTFGGFSGVDRPYLVNQDRVCTPIAIAGGTAAGGAKCEKTAADAIARLSIKQPIVVSGAKAAFVATVAGRTLTITRQDGTKLFTWDAPDPIVRVAELYASQYEDRVAVAYVVRSLGKEVTNVIGFDLGQNQTAVKPPDANPNPTPPVQTPANTPPEDPKVAKAVADARKAAKGNALAAWKAVLVLDGTHSEALFRVAAAAVAAKQQPDALAALQTLAGSQRPDAIEWLVEARFDPGFAGVRAEPKFRAAVGLDRKPTSVYERLMGFGGQWEQTGTSCDKPEVKLVATRDRAIKIRVKTTCEGQVFDTPFKGTWRIDGDHVVIVMPNHGKATAADEAPCGFEAAGDEDGLHCNLGHDIEFTVLPARR